MADESFLVPDSYESSSQYHFSQTQTQTQTQTQPLSQPAGDYFPSNLWGLLVSTSATPTDAELARREKENQPNAADEEYVERPGRVEMAWGTTECKIGRHPKADVVLNGKKISSWHARIFLDPDGDDSVRLEDTSTNGTFVRGQKVRSSPLSPFLALYRWRFGRASELGGGRPRTGSLRLAAASERPDPPRAVTEAHL